MALWKPCQTNRQMFQSRVICNTESQRNCEESSLEKVWEIDIPVLHSSDICDPHYSWSATSTSSCIQLLLFRLQEIWLAKFVTTGVVMPGIALMRGTSPMEHGAVLGSMAIYMSYAMVSSGHLPLMMLMLLVAFLAEGQTQFTKLSLFVSFPQKRSQKPGFCKSALPPRENTQNTM